MNTDWLYSDLWRAHVSWLTPRWVDTLGVGRQDFDAVRWLDQLQAAHYQTLIFYAKFHDGQCTFRSRYTDYCTARDYLGECVTEVRKRGMRILTYYSACIDQHVGSTHPDWQIRRRDGAPTDGFGFWPDACCCLNHPDYRAFLLGQLAELCRNYRPDGIWLDIYEPLIQYQNANCFCPSCQEKYRAETDGGSLFDTHDGRWYQACYAALLVEIKTLITGINPDCALGLNTGLRHPDYDRTIDFNSQERFTAPAISLYCRSVRPLGKPFETTTRLYSSVHSWAVKSHDRVLLEALASVVHGGAACHEVMPTQAGRFMDEALARVAEVGGYIRAIEPYLLNTQPVYDVGIFQPEEQFGCPWGTTALAGSWMSALIERDVPFACLYAGADLSPYRLVILDASVVPDEALAVRLAHYVEQGGNLIVECGAAFDVRAERILEDVLGIEGRQKTGGVAHYLSGLDSRISADMGEDDLIVEGEAFRVAVSTASPLAFFRYELTERKPIKDLYLNLPPGKARSDDPSITLNSYGKGRAMYMACPLTTVELRNHRNNGADARDYPTQLAANLARFMVMDPLLRGTTPAGVEVVVNRQEGRHVVHLLNHYVTGQYYDNRKGILKLADVPVAVNERRCGGIKRAYHLKCGKKEELAIRRDGPWVEVRIQELGVHELIVFDQ